jgi:glutaredoxin-related protein
MPRHVLDESRIHPSVREKIASSNRDLIDEVEAAIKANDVVIVGMAQNPVPRKARGILEKRGVPFKYMEYGSYLSTWRRRNALKMWTGWPTFPMIFVKGTFIGGCDDMERLLESGDFDKLLKG